jgi:putative ABC transport system substrate-binding protein
MVIGSTLFTAHVSEIVSSIERHRVPAMYTLPVFVDGGGLLSYGSNPSQLFGQASGYVDKILRGERPGDLAVQQQNRFELVLNLKAAKAQGLTFPKDLVERADRIIE